MSEGYRWIFARRVRQSLLLGYVVFAFQASAPVLAAEEYKGDVTDVSVVRRMEQVPGSALLWEPYIAEWKPKNLVVAFGAGIAGKTDMGDIFASVSNNDGKSWSEPVYVFDHHAHDGPIQFAYANPILFKPPGQAVIWCYAQRCPMTRPHSEDAQLCGAFSADGGLSWTPVELAMGYTQPLIVVAGIYTIEQDGHPLYLLPAHRNSMANDPLGSREQFVLSSTSLLEWRLRGYVPRPAGNQVFMHEGSIAEGEGPGELKMVCRTGTYQNPGVALDPPRAYSSTSKDGGKTWTTAEAEPDLWNSVSKGYFGKSRLGFHIYVYSDGPAWQRKALRYKIQSPGGKWSDEMTFYDAAVHDSYPTLIEHAPGEYYCVWDCGTADRGRTHIRFGKLKVELGK
ncbi:MAG TPA: sialidase family protein [Tepidisphaeraceae bacterium]|jgi:hypothetical protein|nr:sialidase family protein [Tepidisphaeraceae bacterium]